MAVAAIAMWIPLVPNTGGMLVKKCRSTLHIGMMSRPLLALFFIFEGIYRIWFGVALRFLSLLLKFVFKITT